MRANQMKRIERLEQSLKEHRWFSTHRVSFPETQPPLYGFGLEFLLLKRLKCPLHGERSIRFNPIFVSQWVREKIPRFVQRQSEQYRKAWFATFLPIYGQAWKKKQRMAACTERESWPNARLSTERPLRI